jgi:glycosyltransferase involved in cell wall biosynthesis
MKIAVIGPILSSSGTSTHVLNIVKGISLFSDVVLITFSETNQSKDISDLKLSEKVVVHQFSENIEPCNFNEFAEFIASIIQSEKITVLHPQIKPFILFCTVLAKKKLGSRGSSVQIIGTWHSNFGWIKDAKYHLALSFMAAPYLDGIIPVSENVLHELKTTLSIPRDKIKEIIPPGGIDFELLQKDRRDQFDKIKTKFGITKPYIVYLARLAYNKGVDTLLKAFKPLSRDYELIIIGTGPYEIEYKQQMKDMSLDNSVIFTSHIPTEEVYTLLQNAEVYCLSSRWESFSISTLEAMAAGLPVVCSNVGGLPTWIGDAGILLDPEDHNAFTEALQQVLIDPKLASALQTKSLELAKTYDWRELAKKTVENIRNTQMSEQDREYDEAVWEFGPFSFVAGGIHCNDPQIAIPSKMRITPYALFFPSEALENEKKQVSDTSLYYYTD